MHIPNNYLKISIAIILSILLSGCFTSEIDKKSRKYFKQNIKKEKVLLYAFYDGSAGIGHNFTLRENQKFAYTSVAFGIWTYCVGDWSKEANSDTIHLNYYQNHGLDFVYPHVLLIEQRDSTAYDFGKKYIQFERIDTTRRRFWNLDVLYLKENFK